MFFCREIESPYKKAPMPVVWPTLLDLSRDECKRILRKLELEAYAGVVSALRAQGDLTKEKKDLLGELSKVLCISTERHRAEVRRAVNDERLTTIAHHMSGPNSSSEWSIEGRRLVPLMPRLVPQTAFTVTANAVANAAVQHNASLPSPAETGNKEVVVCYSYTSTTSTPTSTTVPSGSVATVKSPRPASPASNVVVLPSGSTVYVKSVSCSDEDEKPRKRRRTNSSSSSPVVTREVPKAVTPVSKTITVPVTSSSKMSNIMQSIANSLPPHMSPVKITFTKPSTQTTNTTTQKVIIVTTSPSSTFVPNILSKSHNYAAVTKLVPTSVITSTTQKQPMVITASQSSLVAAAAAAASSSSTLSSGPSTVAVTSVVSSTPSVVMSAVAQGASSTAVKVSSARLPSPKTLVGSPTQILAQFPKQHQQSAKQQTQSPLQQQTQGTLSSQAAQQHIQQSQTPSGVKPTIQIKQESGVKIITQQMQPSKILPKPATATMQSSSSSPIMVVSSNGAIMTTKLVTTPSGTQTTYSRPTVTPTLGARMAASPAGATYVKTTSGSIITVVPKSLATLGGKIISSNMSGTTTKITTIPMTSKPNVIVVQKATGKGATFQGLPGKNVVTTLLNAGGEKTIQAMPAGTKPAIITATRPITKMIVTQPKGMGATVQPTTKIIPTKIVYGQQGKTQVLIKPKPVTFQAAMVSEHTRQLVTETLQQASRVAEGNSSAVQEGVVKEESHTYIDSSSSSIESSQSSQESQSVVHVITTRSQDWTDHEVSMESSPTIIYQEATSESQSATSTIKALLELQQTTVKEKMDAKPRQHTIDLSQMAVPIQMTHEKRQSPENPAITVVESDLVTEYISTVKTAKPGTSTSSMSPGEVALTSLLSASHQQLQSQPQRTLVQQQVVQAQTTSQAPVLVKSIPVSSTGTVTHIMQQVVSSHITSAKQMEDLGTEEGEVEEMDTLDPQTGLFYRSAQTLLQKPQKQSQLSADQSCVQAHMQQQPPMKQQLKQATTLEQLQAQHRLQQAAHQLYTKQLQKQTAVVQRDQEQPRAPLQQQQPPPQIVAKERLVSSAVTQPQQTVVQVLAVKAPQQQLPKLQQMPVQQRVQTQSQPMYTFSKQPASSEKLSAGQVQLPIITQGGTVTKITFDSHQAPTISKSASSDSGTKSAALATSVLPAQPSEKPGVADIVKISMMEAQIETNIEPMAVDSPSERTKVAKAAATVVSAPPSQPQQRKEPPGNPPAPAPPPLPAAAAAASSSVVVAAASSSSVPSSTPEKSEALAVPVTSQFIHIQNLTQKKTEEIPADILIQTIPQYSIPCHSSSNVVVEPSGLLEINNFTSQRIADEETAMEQDVDSSAEEGTEPSPSQSSAEQSQ
ncbi:BRCA2-interacting transcriptional repressor EMSY isoform X2 [Latimeria chalumnae]|uniref:BRCA2-interacting transcriptional repressor EMSY isoform X2 n=1 Tax=Latimeria chalumnae TaxID=7897 RepID=UPI00313AA99E